MEVDDAEQRVRDILQRREALQRELVETESALREQHSRAQSRASGRGNLGGTPEARPFGGGSGSGQYGPPPRTDSRTGRSRRGRDPRGSNRPPSAAERPRTMRNRDLVRTLSRSRGESRGSGDGVPPLAPHSVRGGHQDSYADEPGADWEGTRTSRFFQTIREEAESKGEIDGEDREFELMRQNTGLPSLPPVARGRRWQRAMKMEREAMLEKAWEAAKQRQQLEPIRKLPNHLDLPLMEQARRDIRERLLGRLDSRAYEYKEAYRIFNNPRGGLPFADFARGVRDRLGLSHLSTDALKELFDSLDSAGNGLLSFLEFVQGLFPRDYEGTWWEQSDRQARRQRKQQQKEALELSDQYPPSLRAFAPNAQQLLALVQEKVGSRVGEGKDMYLRLYHFFDNKRRVGPEDLRRACKTHFGMRMTSEMAEAVFALFAPGHRDVAFSDLVPVLVPPAITADERFTQRGDEVVQEDLERRRRSMEQEHGTVVDLDETTLPRAGGDKTKQAAGGGVNDDDEGVQNALAALTGMGGLRAVEQFRSEDEGRNLATFDKNRPAPAGTMGLVNTGDARLWSLTYLRHVIQEKLLSKMPNGNRDMFKSAYFLFGSPADGVSLKTFRDTLRLKLGLTLPQHAAEILFREVDTDDNGMVDFLEFISYFLPHDYPTDSEWSALHAKWRSALARGHSHAASQYKRKLWAMLDMVELPDADAGMNASARASNRVSWDFPLRRPKADLAGGDGVSVSPIQNKSNFGFPPKETMSRNPERGYPGTSLFIPQAADVRVTTPDLRAAQSRIKRYEDKQRSEERRQDRAAAARAREEEEAQRKREAWKQPRRGEVQRPRTRSSSRRQRPLPALPHMVSMERYPQRGDSVARGFTVSRRGRQ